MNKFKIFTVLLCIFTLSLNLNIFAFNQVPLDELYRYGDAFNIEAGQPSLKLNDKQIWLNLVAVLDRPLVDEKTLEEITLNNPYELKESSIESYNEAKINLAVLSIVHHYLENGHELLKKPISDDVVFTLQVHRGKSGKKQLVLFQKLISMALGDMEIQKNIEKASYPGFFDSWYIPEYKTKLEFRYGYENPEEHFLDYYEGTDILFSFGLAGGLNPGYPSGTLLLPQSFTPFDTDHNTVYLNKTYGAKNHLISKLESILENPKHGDLVSLINHTEQFLSPNPDKKHIKAVPISLYDFKEAKLFQVYKNYNPKDKKEHVTLIE